MPTLDPSNYEVVRDVPVVDTFQISRSGQQYTLDDQYLVDIVANHYRRKNETGDLPVIGVTHKERDAEEVIGYVQTPRIQPLANTGRNAIFADLWVRKDSADCLHKYPRRSAEIAYGLRQLDGLALLGSTAPERDLGLLKLSREVPDMADEKDKKDETKTDDGMPKWASELMARLDALEAKVNGGDSEEPTGDTNEDEELAKFLAELQAEGGGGGEPTPQPEKDQMQLSRKVAKLEADLAERDLRDKLLKLQSEGYQINVADEIKFAMALDPETRTLHLSRIEKNYPKAPVSGKPLDGLADAKTAETKFVYTEEDRTAVKNKLNLMRKSDPTARWEDAFYEVKGFSPNQIKG